MNEHSQRSGSSPAFGTLRTASETAPMPFVEAQSSSLGPSRFAVITRTGEYWSYPYSYVGLIECPSPESLTIHCCDGKVASIEISGRGLDAVAVSLCRQRLIAITESDHVDFRQGGVVVSRVQIIRVED